MDTLPVLRTLSGKRPSDRREENGWNDGMGSRAETSMDPGKGQPRLARSGSGGEPSVARDYHLCSLGTRPSSSVKRQPVSSITQTDDWGGLILFSFRFLLEISLPSLIWGSYRIREW